MSTTAPFAPPPESSASRYDIRCLEVWGGTEAVDTSLAVPGIDVWVFSQPHSGDERGGDIHYISSCFTGRVARFALADVSGHGESAGDMAITLRRLMRKHINYLDQTALAQVLNREFNSLASAGRFATAVLMSYFAPTDNLIVCNAGHPRPLWYSATDHEWRLLHHETPQQSSAPNNLPLGIIDPTDYIQFAVRLGREDMVLLYTDSLTEAADPAGCMLGESGLLALARNLRITTPEQTGRALLDAIAAHRDHAPSDDDQTLLVLHHHGSDGPRRPIRGAIRAVAAMLGLAGD